MEWITPEDIVTRLNFRKRIWFDGPPTVKIEGEEGRFGFLVFVFPDEEIRYGVYLQNKQLILTRAIHSIQNYTKIITAEHEKMT